MNRLEEYAEEYYYKNYPITLNIGGKRKEKWHYLKENPNDLPKNREKILLFVKLNDKWNRTKVLIGYRDFGDCLEGYFKDWGIF